MNVINHEEILKGRKRKSLTQADLARIIGTSQQNVGRWENGEVAPNGKWIRALEDVLDIKLVDGSSALDRATVRPLKPLPFLRLSDSDFEKIIRTLIDREYPNAIRYGVRGDKQDGIDIDSMDGSAVIWQCKKVSKFGKKDAENVVEAYKKGGRDSDKEKIIAVAKEGVNRSAIDVLKNDDWVIWDAGVIMDKIMALPEYQQRMIVRRYFCDDPIILTNCLGLSADNATLVSVKEYFGWKNDGVLSYDNKYYKTNGDPLDEIADELAKPENRIIVLHGPGGVGKSRRVKELADRTGQDLLIVRDGCVPRDSDVRNSLEGGAVIVLDDAHRAQDALRRCLEGYASCNKKTGYKKFIVVTRSYLKDSVLCSILEFAREEEIVELGVPKLGDDDSRKIAGGLVDKEIDAIRLANAADGNALILTLGAKKMKSCDGVPAKLINRGGSFLKSVFDSYIADAMGEDKKELGSDALQIIAVIQPCSKDAVIKVVSGMFNLYDKVSIRRTIDKLEACGLLNFYGGNLRITPDLLADYECGQMLIGKNGSDIGVLDDIIELAGEGMFMNILQNLCQLDWKTDMKTDAKKMVQHMWHKYEIKFKSADTGKRIEMLWVLDNIAFFEPEKALSLIDIAMEDPAKVEAVSYDGRKIKNEAVLKGLTLPLFRLSYIEDYIKPVMKRLIRLARENPSWARGEKHPVDIMKRITRYEYSKPYKHVEIAANYILEKGFNTGSCFSPYEVLEECMKTKGSTILPSGKISMTVCQFSIIPEKVADLRHKIMKHAFADICGQDIEQALWATKLIGTALRADGDCWEKEKLWILNSMRGLFTDDVLPPVVVAAARLNVAWTLGVEKEGNVIKDAARGLLGVLSETAESKIARAIIDPWGNKTFVGYDYSEKHNKYSDWLEGLGKEIAYKYANNFGVLMDLLIEDLEWVKKYPDGHASANNLRYVIWSVSMNSDEFCEFFLDWVLKNEGYGELCDVVLSILVNKFGKVEAAMTFVEKVFKKRKVELSAGVANFVTGEVDKLSLEWVVGVLGALLKADNATIRRIGLESLGGFVDKKNNIIVSLLNNMSLQSDDVLILEEIENLIIHSQNGINISDLSEESISRIKDILIAKSELNDNDVEFLRKMSSGDYVAYALEVMTKRVERAVEVAMEDASTFSYIPVPALGSLKIGAAEHGAALNAVRHVLERHDGEFCCSEKLIRFLGLDPELLYDYLLREVIPTKNENLVLCFIRALDSSMVWNVDKITRLFVQSEINGYKEEAILNGLLLVVRFSDGFRGRSVGAPDEHEIHIKESAERAITNSIAGTVSYRLYERILNCAIDELGRQRESDKRLLGKDWEKGDIKRAGVDNQRGARK